MIKILALTGKILIFVYKSVSKCVITKQRIAQKQESVLSLGMIGFFQYT